MCSPCPSWRLLFPFEKFVESSVKPNVDEFVTVIKGDLPLIISCPHGGYMMPEHIPDRKNGYLVNGKNVFRHTCGEHKNDDDCDHKKIPVTRVRDMATKEMIYSLEDGFQREFNRQPYMVICELNRKKLDMNRDLEEATFGHPDSVYAWNKYMNAIKEAKKEILSKYGSGLLIDLHGQSHKPKWVELGYCLHPQVCDISDEKIEEYSSRSSIHGLVTRFSSTHSFAEILRGPKSFGAFLSCSDGWMEKYKKHNLKFYKTILSPDHPGPKGEGYFTGGYTTRAHGSKEVGGNFDAIQMELPIFIRKSEEERTTFGRTFARAMAQYLELYYRHSMI